MSANVRASIVPADPATALPACRVCGAPAAFAFEKIGRFRPRAYALHGCADCGFLFVRDPDTDFNAIYDENYYAGLGADPLVDYLGELENPGETTRIHEWEGIVRRVEAATGRGATTLRWLDYGCGNGGLVRFLRQRGVNALGCDDGWAANRAREHGIPVVSLAEAGASAPFDVVTAIEVIEHLLRPVEALRRIRELTRTGGLLFVTTGNVAPWSGDPSRWSYVVPEIHVSFFTPDSLSRAMATAGFEPIRSGYARGWREIIRFKLLKNLRVRRCHWVHSAIPWSLVSWALDRRYRWTDLPLGRAR